MVSIPWKGFMYSHIIYIIYIALYCTMYRFLCHNVMSILMMMGWRYPKYHTARTMAYACKLTSSLEQIHKRRDHKTHHVPLILHFAFFLHHFGRFVPSDLRPFALRYWETWQQQSGAAGKWHQIVYCFVHGWRPRCRVAINFDPMRLYATTCHKSEAECTWLVSSRTKMAWCHHSTCKTKLLPHAALQSPWFEKNCSAWMCMVNAFG